MTQGSAPPASAPAPQPKVYSRPLPPKANLEQLKKQAKEKLAELRKENPQAKLAQAQHEMAIHYGFRNWRDLKAHVDFLNSPQRERQVHVLFDALRRNDRAAAKVLLDADATLAYADPPGGGHRPILLAANLEHHGAEPGMVDLLLEYRIPVSIFDAAAIGRTGIVASIFDGSNDAELNAVDSDGMTPLLWAMHGRHYDLVSYLLFKGADPNARENTGWTPLHLAAEQGSARYIRALLEKGANADAVLPSGEKPIHIAAKHGHTAAAEALVASEQAWDVWTAAGLGRTDLLQERFADSLNAQLPGSAGHTPIHFAAHAKQNDAVDWLLAHGAELDAISALRMGRFDYVRQRAAAEPGWIDQPDREGSTAMHLCAAHKMHDALRVLIDAGAMLNPLDAVHRATPLGWAEHAEDDAAAAILRGAGAKLATEFNESPEQQAVAAVLSGDAAALATVLDAYPDAIHATGGDWDQPLLHLAATKGHENVVSLLLDRGFNVNARDKGDNAYALHFAAENGQLAVVKRLTEAGSDVHGEGDDHEMGVLGWATCFRNVRQDVAAYLMERGARLHIFAAVSLNRGADVRRIVTEDPTQLDRKMSRNEHLRRPLHHAVRMNRPEMVELLLELGADVDAADATGATALTYATHGGTDARILAALERAGAKLDLLAAISLRRFDEAERLVQEDPARIGPEGRDTVALHVLTGRGDLKGVRWLIEHGVDVNARRRLWGVEMTALHACIDPVDRPEIAEMLFEAEADPNLKDSRYNATPLGWAEHLKRPVMIDLLRGRGGK